MSPRSLLLLLATLFCVATFTLSWWHWWTFRYQTFDLAFYVQSFWLALHGKWSGSLLNVSVLGNHAEPIAFLLIPLFALIPHPMLPVAMQVLAMGTMPFTAWRIAQRLGLHGWSASVLAGLTLLAPATGFIAIHEFHPEAFAAPLLLLVAEARLAGKLRLFWLWFAAGVGCKENIALLLLAWSVVSAWDDRKKGARNQWQWNIAPALVAAVWLAFYAFILSPQLNGGRVDYGNLYAQLGNSGGDIVRNFFTKPRLACSSLRDSLLTGSPFLGNLLWSLLLSFGFLPLLRPRWLLIAAPLFLQHLLSSRPSEWTVFYHYAAPFVPLFWVASAEIMAAHRLRPGIVWIPATLCLLLQFAIGPFREIAPELKALSTTLWDREWKAALIERVASDPSLRVCAGLPYLSHLAKRQELYSLHFVIKGLNTLASSRYEPSYEPDAVLIDYADTATFSSSARYYHPDGSQGDLKLPSSDELLNSFLGRYQWISESHNALSVLTRGAPSTLPVKTGEGFPVLPGADLLRCEFWAAEAGNAFRLDLDWKFTAPRRRIPWVLLILRSGSSQYPLLAGMCSPEIAEGWAADHRRLRIPPNIPAGKYQVSAVFFDKIDALWKPDESSVLFSTSLGEVTYGGK